MRRSSRPASDLFVFHIIGAGFLASVIVVLFSAWWVFDLFSHFRIQYVLAGFLILPVLLWLRKYWVAGIVTCAILFHSVALWPYLQGSRVIAGLELPPHMTILFANVYYESADLDKLSTLIKKSNPDIIIFAEVNKTNYDHINTMIGHEYPESHFEEGLGAYDISYFSKTKPDSFKILDFTEMNPSVHLKYTWNGKPLNIIGMHPHSPVAQEDTTDRDKHLTAAFTYAAELHEPMIMIGDFNISQFSPKFQRLLKNNGLIDTQLEFGLQPSWNANYLPLFRIPIDQVVVTSDIEVYDRYLGEHTGSDHLPVIVEVGLEE